MLNNINSNLFESFHNRIIAVKNNTVKKMNN